MTSRETFERQLKTLTLINELAKKLNSTLELSQIIKYTIESLPKMIGANKCSIFLYDSEHEEIYLAAHNHYDMEQGMDLRISIHNNQLLSQVLRSGQSRLIRDIEAEFGLKNRSKYKNKSSMITLLKSGDQLLGCININDKSDGSEFSEWDFELTQNINEHLATAISNAQLFSQTRRLSITDGLTELYTHRYFQETLEREIVRARRYQKPLSMMMVDIDFFKSVNDTHGHQAGDCVLRDLSARIRNLLRRSDFACRYGGEEMAIILTDTAHDNAISTAERLRRDVENMIVTFLDREISVTVSIGVSNYTPELSKPEMIELADRALYRAKRQGRNRVCSGQQ